MLRSHSLHLGGLVNLLEGLQHNVEIVLRAIGDGLEHALIEVVLAARIAALIVRRPKSLRTCSVDALTAEQPHRRRRRRARACVIVLLHRRPPRTPPAARVLAEQRVAHLMALNSPPSMTLALTSSKIR